MSAANEIDRMHALVGPIFVCDMPREVSPLARPHRTTPGLVEHYDLVLGSRWTDGGGTENWGALRQVIRASLWNM